VLLVIDTATAACSVALISGSTVVAAVHEAVGRGHAERLLPMIAELPGGGKAGAILVNCGPGSFTGVRIGLAAAKALALGWDATLSGYSTHTLIAARCFADNPALDRLTVAMEAGHGEVFIQNFAAPLALLDEVASLPPDVAARRAAGTATGSAAARLSAAGWNGTRVETDVSARDALLLPDHLASLPAVPIYGRGADAKKMVQ
jgi:tRNA threonylcarbamoyl adenosine modification protein YeaZ